MELPKSVFDFKPYCLHHRWGSATFLHQKDGYATKILDFLPGEATSFHYHMKRVERLYVLSGSFILRTNDWMTGALIERKMSPAYMYEIPAGLQHQIQCIDGAGKILETTERYVEEDVMRILDTVNGPSVRERLAAADTIDRLYPGGPSAR